MTQEINETGTADMYREYLLEHYKNPKNKGKIPDADIVVHDSNPLCGDEISMHVKLDGRNISKIMFEGRGCVISMASASILAEYLEEKTVDAIQQMDRDAMLGLLGLQLTPTRIKCAMLALHTLKKGITEHETLHEKNA